MQICHLGGRTSLQLYNDIVERPKANMHNIPIFSQLKSNVCSFDFSIKLCEAMHG